MRQLNVLCRAGALTLLGAAALIATAAANDNDHNDHNEAPAAFHAHYRVSYQGLEVGGGSIALRYDADGGYHMRSDVAADGVAALLFRDKISETAAGQLTAAGPRPLRYRYQQNGGRRERQTTLAFDWPALTVASVYNGDAATLPLADGAIDPLSVYLQVMWRLRRGQEIDDVTLIHRNRVRDYHVNAEGNERLMLPGTEIGELDALRFTRQRPGSSRSTQFWLAPQLDYLPVQVVQYKDGNERLRLILTRIDS